jgi:hypothetical protein
VKRRAHQRDEPSPVGPISCAEYEEVARVVTCAKMLEAFRQGLSYGESIGSLQAQIYAAPESERDPLRNHLKQFTDARDVWVREVEAQREGFAARERELSEERGREGLDG